jgi:hypothetical protein
MDGLVKVTKQGAGERVREPVRHGREWKHSEAWGEGRSMRNVKCLCVCQLAAYTHRKT